MHSQCFVQFSNDLIYITQLLRRICDTEILDSLCRVRTMILSYWDGVQSFSNASSTFLRSRLTYRFVRLHNDNAISEQMNASVARSNSSLNANPYVQHYGTLLLLNRKTQHFALDERYVNSVDSFPPRDHKIKCLVRLWFRLFWYLGLSSGRWWRANWVDAAKLLNLLELCTNYKRMSTDFQFKNSILFSFDTIVISIAVEDFIWSGF